MFQYNKPIPQKVPRGMHLKHSHLATKPCARMYARTARHETISRSVSLPPQLRCIGLLDHTHGLQYDMVDFSMNIVDTCMVLTERYFIAVVCTGFKKRVS